MNTHGEYFIGTIEVNQEYLRKAGKPILVDGKATIELVDHKMIFEYFGKIDLKSIEHQLIWHYRNNLIDFADIMSEEREEYNKIEQTILKKLPYFLEDIHSRRVLWTDDCCISMLQFLIRDNAINCILHFRSSDARKKLPADLFLVHQIIQKVQLYTGVNYVILSVYANSFHENVFRTHNDISEA